MATPHGQKRKRVVLTINQKLDIIKRSEKGENKHNLMKEFGIGSSTIYDIKAQKSQLLEFVTSTERSTAIENRRTLQKPKLANLDKVLYEWFVLKRSEGVQISGSMLTEKAKELYQTMNITEPCRFSNGWLSGFKLRHGILKPDIPGKTKSADEERVEKYCKFFQKLVNEHGVLPEQIYNADETGVWYRCLPELISAGTNETSELISAGTNETSADFKQNNDHLTVLACVNAAGTHKLKLLVVGNDQIQEAFKGITQLPVEYKSHIGAWMDRDIFLYWFHHIFVPEVKENLRETGKPQDTTVILILDNCEAHPPDSELVSGNIFTVFLPANVISLIQPMSQGILQNLKMIYRKNFLFKLVSYAGGIQVFQSTYTIKDAVYNLACAWDAVTCHTLRRAWRKLLKPSILKDDSSDDEQVEGENGSKKSVDEILDVLRNSASSNLVTELGEQDIQEWMNMDADIHVSFVPDDDIRCDIKHEPDFEPHQDPEKSDISDQPNISWEDAEKGLELFIRFCEKHSTYSAQEVMQLHTIHNSFLKKKLLSRRQTDIQNRFWKASAECMKPSDLLSSPHS